MTTSPSLEALEHDRDRQQHPVLASFNSAQVANLLGVSRSSVDRLLRCGDLNSFRVGRARRVTVADLERFIERERCT